MYSDCCTCMHSKQRLLDCLSQSVFFSSCVKVCNEFGMISVVVVDVWVSGEEEGGAKGSGECTVHVVSFSRYEDIWRYIHTCEVSEMQCSLASIYLL